MRYVTLFWLFGRGLTGATYYVAPSGIDSNPGTIDQPWATVSRSVRGVSPGDIIILRDGAYGPEGLTSGFPVWITSSGTPTSWIVLKAENKGGAVLNCSGGPTNVRMGCDGYIYLHSGAAYWVFQDLVFQGGYNFGMSANSTPAAHDILVRGCRFEYIGQHPSDSTYGEAGFYAGPGSTNFTMDGNVFHDIGRTTGVFSFNDHGLYLHASNSTVMNNIFYAPISGWAIQTSDGFSGLIAHNTFAFPMRNNGGHIILWQTNSSITIRNNIFYNPTGGVAILSVALSVPGGCSVDHNVISGGVAGIVSGCSFSNNLLADPALVNAWAPPYDFHLLPGSPAIDEGILVPSTSWDFDGSPRPQGPAPDAGAYEMPAGGLRQTQPPQQPAAVGRGGAPMQPTVPRKRSHQ
jgi:hypothetical protein